MQIWVDVHGGEGRHKARLAASTSCDRRSTLPLVFLINIKKAINNRIIKKRKEKDQRFVKVIHINHNALELFMLSKGQP